MPTSIDLTSLIGSRICHDLISPLGAIGNGVELLAMSGMVAGPEMSLISESVENANARIKFYRIAFGAAEDGSELQRGEVTEILGGLSRGGRHSIHWQVEGPIERRLAKLTFLCLQCLESAVPWGGRITVRRQDEAWSLVAEASRLREIDALWSIFDTPSVAGDLAPADLQFALAPIWAQELGMSLRREVSEGRIEIDFMPARAAT